MNENVFSNICVSFGWDKTATCATIGSGLINATWKVVDATNGYILQKINTGIFVEPQLIDDNLQLLSNYFKQYHAEYLFTAPLKNLDGKTIVKIDENYFRCFTFIKNSHTINIVENPQQAYEAAFQFGNFTALLNELNTQQLKITLPDFHNLGLRFQQFETAMVNGNTERIAQVKDAIHFMQSQKNIVDKWQKFIHHKEAKQRVTHHDTKISNILFSEANKGLCVIDLDTVMPGYFISDVGDMLRTYVCAVSEEEADFNKIIIRFDFMKAIQDGYLQAMQHELSNFEKDHFYFSGEVLMYMQALRFLNDYLNNDVYYGSKYKGHNLVRAKNQIKLLQEFQSVIH